jgi:hypothetical protein
MEDTQCHLRFTCFESGFYLDNHYYSWAVLFSIFFQITEAVDDPVTRTAALFSLIYALVSLCYGCTYVYCEIWYDGKHVPCITMGRGVC